MAGAPTIQITADTSQAVAALKKVGEAVAAIQAPKPKAGLRTSEFWATSVVPALLAVATLVWHRDFSGYVQAAALVAAGVSSAVYAVGRAHLKRPVDLRSILYDLHALVPLGAEVASEVAQVKDALPKK